LSDLPSRWSDCRIAARTACHSSSWQSLRHH
jgi:hypothetical protein